MKVLRKFLDKQGKLFSKGGKLERLHPLYEAIDTFMYTSGKVTPGAAHVRDGLDLKRMMMIVVIAMVPAVLMALYNTGLQANLALAEMGRTSIAGWRGVVLSWFGIGVAPQSIVANMLHGALYFLPVYIMGAIIPFMALPPLAA